MDTNATFIETELRLICIATSSDFAAVALEDRHDRRLAWKYASGHSNNRYLTIQQRMGKGIAGLALQLGRPVAADRSTAARLQKECPLMLAERLTTVIAAPFRQPDGGQGVILAGSRTARPYTREDLEQIKDLSTRIPLLLPQPIGEGN